MDYSSRVTAPPIMSAVASEPFQVVIQCADGMQYSADLSSFNDVYCFPKTKKDWSQVSIDASGLSLIWPTRFEVHVDQVIALSTRKEQCQKRA